MAQSGPRDKATIETLKERMARDPLSRAFLQLAEEYRKAGRFEEAVQVCQEGLARHPGYHTARIALGRTYLDAGDLESAHQALTEVLDTMPENHLAAKLLAEVQLRLGNRAGAAETYRAILSHYPGDREVEGLLDELAAAGDSTSPPSGDSAAPAELPDTVIAAPIEAAPPVIPAPLEVVDGGEPTAPPALESDQWTAVAAPRDELVASLATVVSGQADADAMQTNTLAELYLRQGLVEKALEVYRAMLLVDPDNERARRRLDELSGEQPSRDEAESLPAVDPVPSADRVPAFDSGPAVAESMTTESVPAVPPDPEMARSDPPDAIETIEPVGNEMASSAAQPQPSVHDLGTPNLPSASSLDMAGDPTSPGVQSEMVARRAAQTIDRLQRWLASVRTTPGPPGQESQR